MKWRAYTDGGCDLNPSGKGGAGIVLFDENGNKSEYTEAWYPTTNNRMEIRAIIVALLHTEEGDSVTIYSDSKYAILCANGTWKRKKNLDLWEDYDKAAQGKSIVFQWVKGHADNKFNNRADALATGAIKKKPAKQDTGYIEEMKASGKSEPEVMSPEGEMEKPYNQETDRKCPVSLSEADKVQPPKFIKVKYYNDSEVIVSVSGILAVFTDSKEILLSDGTKIGGIKESEIKRIEKLLKDFF